MLSTIKTRLDKGSFVKRTSNFELLRIAAAVMIVSHHYAGDRSFQFDRSGEQYSWQNEYYLHTMETTGKIGVSVLILMTGYFQYTEAVKLSSFARTWFKTLCWSYIVAFLWFAMGKNPLEYEWRVIFLPVFSNNYWFVTTYIAAACLSGWAAAICASATPAQYMSGLATMFVLISLFEWGGFISVCNTQWFFFVIVLGGFLRRFRKHLDRISMFGLIALFAMMLITVWGSLYVFMFYGVDWSDRHGSPNTLVRENWCPTSVMLGVVIVLIAARSKKFVSPMLNRFASLSLGVYLLHEHFLVWQVLWKDWVNGVRFRDHRYMPIICLSQVFVVYMVCSLLEFLRQLLLSSIEAKLAEFADDVGRKSAHYINRKLEKHEKV